MHKLLWCWPVDNGPFYLCPSGSHYWHLGNRVGANEATCETIGKQHIWIYWDRQVTNIYKTDKIIEIPIYIIWLKPPQIRERLWCICPSIFECVHTKYFIMTRVLHVPITKRISRWIVIWQAMLSKKSFEEREQLSLIICFDTDRIGVSQRFNHLELKGYTSW